VAAVKAKPVAVKAKVEAKAVKAVATAPVRKVAPVRKAAPAKPLRRKPIVKAVVKAKKKTKSR
jgi:hypothetical protein